MRDGREFGQNPLKSSAVRSSQFGVLARMSKFKTHAPGILLKDSVTMVRLPYGLVAEAVRNWSSHFEKNNAQGLELRKQLQELVDGKLEIVLNASDVQCQRCRGGGRKGNREPGPFEYRMREMPYDPHEGV